MGTAAVCCLIITSVVFLPETVRTGIIVLKSNRTRPPAMLTSTTTITTYTTPLVKRLTEFSPATGSDVIEGQHGDTSPEVDATVNTATSTSNSRTSSDQSGDRDPTVSSRDFYSFDVYTCMRQTRPSWDLHEERVELSYAFNASQSHTPVPQGTLGCHLSVTAPRGMIVQMAIVRMSKSTCSQLYLELYQLRHATLHTLFRCSPTMTAGREGVVVVESDINKAQVTLTHHTFVSSFTLLLRLTFLPAPDPSQLELRYLSPSKGYVQTPGLYPPGLTPPGQSPPGLTPYPGGMSSRVRLAVPPDHWLMATFIHMDVEGRSERCGLDAVCLYTRGGHRLLACHCQHALGDPRLLWTRALHVHFVSYRPWGNSTGFRLLFSFHRSPDLPALNLGTEQWNCSVPYWEDFKDHFVCNLVSNCLRGEDEQHCPYTSASCPHAHFLAAGRCFRYVDPKSTLTWHQAARRCEQGEGRGSSYLASFNTPEEWAEVTTLLRVRTGSDVVDRVYVGLRYAGDALPHMYMQNLQWMDSTIAFFVHSAPYYTWRADDSASCGYLDTGHHRPPSWVSHTTPLLPGQDRVDIGRCDLPTRAAFLCETDTDRDSSITKVPVINMPPALSSPSFSHISPLPCPKGHVTHSFLACDVSASCWASGSRGDVISCGAPVTPLPPRFTCDSGQQRVSYSVVCDVRPDCSDSSDEDFCVRHPCPFDWFQCGDRQCVQHTERCDDVTDCVNGHDELHCNTESNKLVRAQTRPPPATVRFPATGRHRQVSYIVHGATGTPPSCPLTHFRCPGDGYCLPVFLRCNGVHDCPGKEDEARCEDYSCPGLYRCRGSRLCLHADHVCDDMHHCPLRDDELFCRLPCPPRHCTCYGLAYFCSGSGLQAADLTPLRSQARFLDVSGTGVTSQDVDGFSQLVHLSLARCSLSRLHAMRFGNLRSLDLSDNLLTSVDDSHFGHLNNLVELTLAGNPLRIDGEGAFLRTVPTLLALDLSRVPVSTVGATFSGDQFHRLESLNLSHTGITAITPPAFTAMAQLTVLDLRGCPVTDFTPDLFRDLDLLERVYADNYKLCCRAVLPVSFNAQRCVSPRDEISSCRDLLRSDVYRVFLALFALLAVIGNTASCLYRAATHRRSHNKAFNLLVTHLCVADGWMGVYLAIIGVADQLSRGRYLWRDTAWRRSAACRAAGFLSVLSSEVSALIICLITLDRFLALRFPLRRIRFGVTSAHVTLAVTWCVGVALAGVPLLPATSGWDLYGRTAICIPLPVTRRRHPGREYAFGMMVGLNLALFLLIAAGQLFIYRSVAANRMASSSFSSSSGNGNAEDAAVAGRRARDFTLARRLLTVAVSDFLCWFPVGLLGLLAARGVSIPGEVTVTLAIFVLPLNSALNPFLYTWGALRERRRRRREQRLRQFFLQQAKHADRRAT